MTGKLSKNFHGVGIGPLSNILADKCCGFGSCGFLPDLKKRLSQELGVYKELAWKEKYRLIEGMAVKGRHDG